MAARAVERRHQLGAEALPERMVRHERLELPDEVSVAPEPEVCVDACLKGTEPKLLEPRGLALRERLGAEFHKSRPAPERQRVAQRDRCELSAAFGERPLPFSDEPLEAVQVELLGLELRT